MNGLVHHLKKIDRLAIWRSLVGDAMKEICAGRLNHYHEKRGDYNLYHH
jgi:hypothetical protein